MSADSGVASTLASDTRGLTDSGIGESVTAVQDQVQSSQSGTRTDADVSEPGSSSAPANGGSDSGIGTQPQQQETVAAAGGGESTAGTALEVGNIDSSGSGGIDQEGGTGGGWEGDLDDLGDLDSVALEGSESTVDLDLLPTPSGSEADLGQKSSSKQD